MGSKSTKKTHKQSCLYSFDETGSFLHKETHMQFKESNISSAVMTHIVSVLQEKLLAFGFIMVQKDRVMLLKHDGKSTRPLIVLLSGATKMSYLGILSVNL